MTERSPSPGELAHHGVKGMKWGVRRAKDDSHNAGYSSADRNKDQFKYGSRGVKSINRRMNNGESLAVARKKQTRRTVMKAAAIVAVYNAPHILNATASVVDKYGSAAAYKVATKAETNRGRASAAETMGLPRQASTGPNYAKKSKDGAFKVSSF